MSGDFVTVRLGGQLLGIPVLLVHDVLRLGVLTRVPRAPAMVAGVMNLRGRIVTAIDVRQSLGLPPRDAAAPSMGIVVEQDGQPYALVVDAVGDVVSVAADRFEAHPATLSPAWRAVTDGVYRLDELMLSLNIGRLLAGGMAKAA
ncbi:chemotaxis protein CheW [Sphingoaurantiacus capsulatus]|uniref:Chemotaxis protein CheW n=1 Tax=Sphingoaurantiacus capsulatus TaxID=1771310 RepID=A0ABV7XEN6_9SPHN